MKLIELSKGKFSKVDDEDYEKLSMWKWTYSQNRKNGNEYASRYECKNGVKNYIYMHREIMNAPQSMPVDHINGDGLDNQKANLRICENSQNQMNRKMQANNKSGYKGVSRISTTKRWVAFIGLRGRHKNIGIFDTPEEAAHAYDIAAKEIHREFARINFPDANSQGGSNERSD